MTDQFEKMDPFWKEIWLDALHSGDYKQTSDLMCASDGENYAFCCLGVLRHQMTGTENKNDFDRFTDEKNRVESISIDSYLLAVERIETNLDIKAEDELMRMNDSGNFSFKQIANWIKKNL